LKGKDWAKTVADLENAAGEDFKILRLYQMIPVLTHQMQFSIIRISMNPPMSIRYETFNPYVLAQIPPGLRVLDVGCATGLLGKALRARGAKKLVGIEGDPSMAAAAGPFYDRVVCANLESDADHVLGEETFDIIVCADVLEHLREPATVLASLSRHLDSRGRILISVPNIAFLSVRLSLLMGRWNYNPNGGILDRGHLRFFTRTTLVRLIQEAGLNVAFVRGYNLVRPRYAFLKILGVLWPRLFAIQFLAAAGKP